MTSMSIGPGLVEHAASYLRERLRLQGGGVLVLSGLPGIGKTHMIREAVIPQLIAAGARSVCYNCYTDRARIERHRVTRRDVIVLDEFDTYPRPEALLRTLGRGVLVLILNDLSSHLSRSLVSLGIPFEHVAACPMSSDDIVDLFDRLVAETECDVASSAKQYICTYCGKNNGDLRTVIAIVDYIKQQGIKTLSLKGVSSILTVLGGKGLTDADVSLGEVTALPRTFSNLQKDMIATLIKLREEKIHAGSEPRPKRGAFGARLIADTASRYFSVPYRVAVCQAALEQLRDMGVVELSDGEYRLTGALSDRDLQGIQSTQIKC
ncbi:hypothetical protein GMRT_23323 [Giardia muris]|uniref:Origin recognition complex subunit 1 n=1 Tax=Giardia muris TaxID=5742 RepID=A0A4Z1SVW6_GIAMU|nr:hypothetical protein GMRT_23323 [Giardia muris]|eukprot:TNJ27718.1 hypothetical protein GMRT_23323 [Giardia muris]